MIKNAIVLFSEKITILFISPITFAYLIVLFEVEEDNKLCQI